MAPRIVIATDKWRGSFGSAEAGDSLAAGVRRVFPDAHVQVLALADGGEGTLDVLQHCLGGVAHSLQVTGSTGATLEASWLELPDGRGVVESARILGLDKVDLEERDPLVATSRGVGEMFRALLEHGCREIILGLGGTVTVDGGAGMASAVGYRLVTEDGTLLPDGGGALERLARIDGSRADSRIAGLQIEAWCDVTNLLLGPRGTAQVFGPQKGADPAAIQSLEVGLECLARRWSRDLGKEVAGLPGSGAAGGLGAGAAAFLGAELVSGAGRVLEVVGFPQTLDGADLVITGEGRYDGDSMPGKLPDVVLAQAAARGVRAVVVCGEATVTDADRDPTPIFSRSDLIDNRGWDLAAADLEELAALAVRRQLPG